MESLSNALADKLLACNGQEGDWAGLDGLHNTVHCTGLHFSSFFQSYVGAWMERGGHKSCHHEGAKLVDLWASNLTRLTMEIWFERA